MSSNSNETHLLAMVHILYYCYYYYYVGENIQSHLINPLHLKVAPVVKTKMFDHHGGQIKMIKFLSFQFSICFVPESTQSTVWDLQG